MLSQRSAAASRYGAALPVSEMRSHKLANQSEPTASGSSVAPSDLSVRTMTVRAGHLCTLASTADTRGAPALVRTATCHQFAALVTQLEGFLMRAISLGGPPIENCLHRGGCHADSRAANRKPASRICHSGIVSSRVSARAGPGSDHQNGSFTSRRPLHLPVAGRPARRPPRPDPSRTNPRIRPRSSPPTSARASVERP